MTTRRKKRTTGARCRTPRWVFSQEAAGRTRGTKRGAASSSQTSREDIEEEEEEETTSPSEGKASADPPSEPRPKRFHQTVLECGVSLQWPLGDALKVNERVQPGVKVIPTVK
jgi:hypothetical protein